MASHQLSDPFANDLKNKILVGVLVVVPLLLTIAAVVLLWNKYVFPSDLILFAIFYVIGGLGITVGYHRMLTHNGFKAPDWFRAFLLIAGATTFDGNPAGWAATHIKHHAHSDEEGDPHSPLEGFWHAHFVWLFRQKLPSVKQYAPHLLEDPVVMWVDRTWALWGTLALLVIYAIGGWTALVWAGGVRIFLISHITWSVNSICHTFGKRPFETTDESRNNWVIGLLAFGEGWHNNHHAFPSNAFHGLHWWQFDLSGLLIKCWRRIGLVWDVEKVSPEAMEQHAARSERTKAAAQKLRENVLAAIWELEQKLEKLAHPGVEHIQGRLHSIRGNLSRATNLKRTALQRYLIELQTLSKGLEPQPA